jgi:lipid-A-disaccharide synthase
MERAPTIAVLAGETSGDQLGGWLMAAMKAKRPDIRFIGLGGPMMEAQGITSLFPIRDIALIGIAEVLPHAFKIMRRIHETVEFIERERPDIVVSIDVPGFVLRVMKKLHKRGNYRPKLVHYVAPTVWAYRPERAKIMAERFDHLLCLLPFEPPYFEAEKLPTSYIGHEIAWWWKTRGDGAAFRTRHGIAPDAPLLAVFPGSRNGEIKNIWPVLRASIDQIAASVPGLRITIQVPPGLVERMRAETKGWPLSPIILPSTEEKKDLFAAATAALAKSGTIGLECALAGLPSVIAYRGNPISAYMVKRMIKVKYVNLANILADAPIIPEKLQWDCTSEKITESLLPLLNDAAVRDAQRTQLDRIAAMLGTLDSESPSEKAASIVLGMLN